MLVRMSVHLAFVKEHMRKPDSFLGNMYWSDGTKLESYQGNIFFKAFL